MPASRPKSTRQEKVDYLIEHWDEFKLDGYPWGLEPGESVRLAGERYIINRMRKRRLLSVTTYWKDVDIFGMIRDARREKRLRRRLSNGKKL